MLLPEAWGLAVPQILPAIASLLFFLFYFYPILLSLFSVSFVFANHKRISFADHYLVAHFEAKSADKKGAYL